jgi:hypothetical protein
MGSDFQEIRPTVVFSPDRHLFGDKRFTELTIVQQAKKRGDFDRLKRGDRYK